MSENKVLGLEDNLSYCGAPYQQLVTDKYGNAQWIDRPFYAGARNVTANVWGEASLDSFPSFSVGDTVTVNVDGVEYSLVAYEDDGLPNIGDTYSSFIDGKGQFGWLIFCRDRESLWFSSEPHTISYSTVEEIKKIDGKYLPKVAFITYNNGDWSSDFSYDELHEKLLYGENVIHYTPDESEYIYLYKWTESSKGIYLYFDGTTTLLFSPDGAIDRADSPSDPTIPS